MEYQDVNRLWEDSKFEVAGVAGAIGIECGRVVSWLENGDLPQCHRGGERSEILKPAERRHLVELPASQYNL